MKKPIEIYIHIPFCVRKCNYCDFLSMPCDEGTKDAYMDALYCEITEKSQRYGDYEVISIFIGGGTPSTVKPMQIKRILDAIYRNYCVCEKAEITIEINPGTVDRQALLTYKDAGVNRLSIGLQTADDQEGKRLGRIHSYDEFIRAYFSAREVGFLNVNVDVMSAIPGQSRESYMETLKKVVSLSPPPEHISAYSLIVEEGTPFYEEEKKGSLNVPDEETERIMYEDTKRFLASQGYHRYEISNYAKEGYECRHNKGYWIRTDYVGFGIGSASLVNNRRFSNDTGLAAYIKAPLLQETEVVTLSQNEAMSEFMFLGLRLTEGVSKKSFREAFDAELEEVYGTIIDKHVAQGLLEETDEGIRLTDKGLDVANYVMADFLSEES